MKKFDIINFIGRILIGCYFFFNGIALLISLSNPSLPAWIVFFTKLVAGLGIIAGILLIIGLKPRAMAAALALIILIKIAMDCTWFADTTWEQHHVLQQYIPNKPNVSKVTISVWASQQVHLLMGQAAVFGACLFIAGARTVPHGVMVRSESNMRNKYGD